MSILIFAIYALLQSTKLRGEWDFENFRFDSLKRDTNMGSNLSDDINMTKSLQCQLQLTLKPQLPLKHETKSAFSSRLDRHIRLPDFGSNHRDF